MTDRIKEQLQERVSFLTNEVDRLNAQIDAMAKAQKERMAKLRAEYNDVSQAYVLLQIRLTAAKAVLNGKEEATYRCSE